MDEAASPCVNICVLDPVTGYCIGCGRTGDEIARWMGATREERVAIKTQLSERLRNMTSRATRQGGRRARTTTG